MERSLALGMLLAAGDRVAVRLGGGVHLRPPVHGLAHEPD